MSRPASSSAGLTLTGVKILIIRRIAYDPTNAKAATMTQARAWIASWRARTTLDDSLDVFACHGAGGIWGTIATGLFASTSINLAGRNGLFFGNPGQVAIQAFACVVVAAFAFGGSYVLLRIINIFSPIRVSPAEEDAGLDISGFGEEAYVAEPERAS